MITPTLADLNEQYRAFWQKRRLRINELLENRHIVDVALKREQKKLAYMRLITSEADRFVIFRHQVDFEEELERAAEELAPFLRVINARRQSAKKPRGKLVDGKSLPQLIAEAFSSAEMISLSEKNAWNELPKAMAKFGITLTVIPGSTIAKDRYSNEFRNKAKTMSRGHFHNLLTSALERGSYQALMRDDIAGLVFTDPPFNVKIDGHATGNGKIRHREFAMAAGEMTSGEFADFLARVFVHLVRHSASGSMHFIRMVKRTRRRVAKMASPLQLAPSSWQSRLKAAHQQTRPGREQPLEAPHLGRGQTD